MSWFRQLIESIVAIWKGKTPPDNGGEDAGGVTEQTTTAAETVPTTEIPDGVGVTEESPTVVETVPMTETPDSVGATEESQTAVIVTTTVTPDGVVAIKEDSTPVAVTTEIPDGVGITDENSTQDVIDGTENSDTNENSKPTKQNTRIGNKGRGSSPSNTPKSPSPREKKPKPQEECELICQNFQGKWRIYLKLISSETESDFSQNGEKLIFDDNKKCYLTKFSGIIKYNSGETLLFNDKKPLIFRFDRNWRTGEQVFTVTRKRHYLIIVPKEWSRTGQAANEDPEYCEDSEFRAHFFDADTDTIDGFDQWTPDVGGLNFPDENAIYDNSDILKGDLFGKNLPELKGDGWENVPWIRVGKKDNNEWHTDNLSPHDKPLTEVVKGNVGWFYMRVYDDNGKKTNSFKFRFSATLARILMNGREYAPEQVIFPGARGHDVVKICFEDVNGNNMPMQLLIENDSHVAINDNVATVQPCPKGDFTRWDVGGVEIDIMIPRVWWQFGDDKWRDTPMDIEREKFYDLRDSEVKIYTPMNMRVVQVGINNGNMENVWGTICRDIGRCRIVFSLRKFADAVNQSAKDMKIEIQCREKKYLLFDIRDDFSLKKPSEPARVKTSWGWRYGKGFSRAELSRLGIGNKEIQEYNIKIDKRRRTVHCDNIAILANLIKGRGDADSG